jgi:SP family arabinose:H+ symporter-like MFS transporter
VEEIGSTCQKETSTVTIREAFTLPQYRSGSWVALIIMVFHELSAINAILLYTNKILSEASGGKLSPRVGTDAIGIINLLSSAMSIFSAKKFSRRFLFIWGHITMGICHILVGLFF